MMEHVLGLDDAYPSANGGIGLKNNMAFLEQKYQAYFNYKERQKSRAIRLNQTLNGD